jgi:hypothetical protein
MDGARMRPRRDVRAAGPLSNACPQKKSCRVAAARAAIARPPCRTFEWYFDKKVGDRHNQAARADVEKLTKVFRKSVDRMVKDDSDQAID